MPANSASASSVSSTLTASDIHLLTISGCFLSFIAYNNSLSAVLGHFMAFIIKNSYSFAVYICL